jgi:hypothetical protein
MKEELKKGDRVEYRSLFDPPDKGTVIRIDRWHAYVLFDKDMIMGNETIRTRDPIYLTKIDD